VTINGTPIDVKDLRKFRIRVPAGPQTITIGLVEQRHWAGVDDLYARSRGRRDDFENVTINGPFDATGPGDTPSRRAIFVCHPKDAAAEAPCARQIFTHLATHAFRRPVRADDPSVDLLMQFYAAGRKQGDFETGIQNGVSRMLADPQFL
jgi:hypothetical protein